MFIRQTRGRTEVCEAFRHPVTRRPTNRCIARWSSDRSIADEIAVIERAYAEIAAILERPLDQCSTILDLYLRRHGPAHRLKLERRLAGLYRARDGLAGIQSGSGRRGGTR